MRAGHVTGRHLPPRRWYVRPVALLTGLGLGGLFLAGCSAPPGGGQPATPPVQPPASAGQSATSSLQPVPVGQPVEVAEAYLDDKLTTGQNGQTSWTTTWRVCFKPGRADTTRLEAQAVTTEGSGTSLRALTGRCLELEVARGQNDADAGMPGRDVQLSDAAALAYRVRAAHDDGTVTPWSAPIPVGSSKP